MLPNTIKMNDDVKALMNLMRVKYGAMDAETAMCWELIVLNQRVSKLEAELDKETHRAFHRLPPIEPISHPTRVPTSIPPAAVDDDWISTGRDMEAAA